MHIEWGVDEPLYEIFFQNTSLLPISTQLLTFSFKICFDNFKML